MTLRKAKFREAARRELETKARANREAFQAQTPRVKPHETVGFANEEDAIISYLTDRQPRWTNMWSMLNALGKKDATYWVISRPNRQRLMATLIRLISEKRVLYVRRDRSCLLSPTPSSPPEPVPTDQGRHQSE